jgi:hypothetical protein
MEFLFADRDIRGVGHCRNPAHTQRSTRIVRRYMSAKKKRAWFVCPQWKPLVSDHYPNDAEAAKALGADARVLAKLRSGVPVAKSTALKMLRRAAGRHPLSAAAEELVNDTRSR